MFNNVELKTLNLTQIQIRILQVRASLAKALEIMRIKVGDCLHHTDELIAIGVHFEKLLVKI